MRRPSLFRSVLATPIGLSSLASRQFHSRALEQAMRITGPCPEHPATGSPIAADDLSASHPPPTLHWREHWDPQARKPFYHNLVSNEVTWDVPSTFPTRFGWHYDRCELEDPQLFSTTAAGRARNALGSDALGTAAVARKPLTWKERIYNYGTAGLIVYGVVHFGMLAIIIGIIWMGVDLSAVARQLGFNVQPGATSIMATVVVGIAVNKIFVPIQVGLTIYLAPRCAPYLRRLYRLIMT